MTGSARPGSVNEEPVAWLCWVLKWASSMRPGFGSAPATGPPQHYPDPSLARSMASEAIAIAAHSHLPTSLNIHMRLQRDEEYMTKMCRLVSRIALILNINLLMLLAMCSHCPFPRGGQGTMCRHDSAFIFLGWTCCYDYTTS